MATLEAPASVRCGVWGLLGAGLFAWTLRRGLNPMYEYWFSHWLFSYKAGFIKRGLIGAIVRPALVGRDAAGVHRIVDVLAGCVFVLLCGAIVLAGARIAAVGDARGSRFLWLVILAFFGSSAIVVMASTFGSFDHLLLLVTLVAVERVRVGQLAAAASLCVVGSGIHEMFAFYGLPVVLYAMVLKGGGRALCWALPAFLALGALTMAQGAMEPAQVAAVRADLAGLHVLSEQALDNAVYHLRYGFIENLRMQGPKFVERAFDPDIIRVAFPSLFVLVCTTMALSDPPWRLWVALVAFAPMVAHFFGGDATRFTHLAVMQAFACLLTLLRVGRPRALEAEVKQTLGIAALLALAASLAWPTPLMSGYVDTGYMLRLPP